MAEKDFTLTIPSRLVKRARELGIDVVSVILDALVKELRLDPKDEAEVYLELAERYLEEAKEYIVKGDPVQASEKMYKAVEESLKALALIYRTPEYEKALREGRWWTQLLGKTARRLSKILGEPRIIDTWSRAYDVHVWGFHEAKYSVDDIREDLECIEWLLEYTKRRIREVLKH